MPLTKEQIEQLKAEGRYTVLPPDPKLSSRTGYELANRWSRSSLARTGAKNHHAKEFHAEKKENKKLNQLRRESAFRKKATVRQREFMDKLGIEYSPDCTLREAARMIDGRLGELRLQKKSSK